MRVGILVLSLVVAAAMPLTAAGAATGATPPAAPVPTTASAPAAGTRTQVPDTAYAVPSGAVFLSPTGSDSADGSVLAPLRTLRAALAAVPSGGTVVARAGVYHDGAVTTAKRFTLQPYPHEQVWFDGTDEVTGWTASGAGQWTRAGWSTPSFCAGHYDEAPYGSQSRANTGPCTHQDMALDPRNPAAGDPQMLFVDGVAVPETTSASPAAGTFSYDQSAHVVHLGLDPTGHRVEMAARASALVLQGGTGAAVRGIGFRRYATNEYNGNATHGAVLAGEPGVLLDSDAFVEQAGAGVSVSDARGGVVRSTLFVRNGFNGLDVNGHQHSTGARDGFSLLGSTFTGNNTELFGTGCSASCAAAGSKMAHVVGLTVKGNTFADTAGSGKGFWCDLACSDAVVVDNAFTGNGDTGLYYEVSDTGLIASNLITGNHGYGLKVSAAHTRIVNNTLAGNGPTAVLVYDDARSPGVGGWTDVGPDTTEVSLSNNVVSGGSISFWRTSAAPPNTGPGTFLAGMDHDSYWRASPGTLVDWRDGATTSAATIAALRSGRGLEADGQDLVGATVPFFSGPGDYRIAASSSAHGSGAPLAADVAAAVGVAAGVPVDRGALVWPGHGTPAAAPSTLPSGAPTSTPSVPPTGTPTSTPSGSATGSPAAGAAVTLTRTAPADGSTASGTVSLTASARGATSAQLRLGSALAKSYSGPGPYRFDLASGRVPDGTPVHVTWTVTGPGGSAVSHTTVVVHHASADTAPPVLTTTAPQTGAPLTGLVQLRAQVPAGSAATTTRLYLGSSLAHTFTGSGPYRFGFDSTRLPDGTRVHITWRTTDGAGNTSQVEQYATVTN